VRMRLSHVVLGCALAALWHHARAETFFQAEAGLGAASTATHGDGTWYQLGVPHKLNTVTPALMLGANAQLWRGEAWDLRAHLDYTYIGEQAASCICVTDAQYNTHTHAASVPGYIPFNGHGHVQGVSLTLEPGFTWHGFRFAVEAGPWVFWSTWHVTHNDPAQPGSYDLSHKTNAQLRWVAGASISRGDFSLRYRYYNESVSGASNPPLQTSSQVLMIVYSHRF
jgi:hypothetical protein